MGPCDDARHFKEVSTCARNLVQCYISIFERRLICGAACGRKNVKVIMGRSSVWTKCISNVPD